RRSRSSTPASSTRPSARPPRAIRWRKAPIEGQVRAERRRMALTGRRTARSAHDDVESPHRRSFLGVGRPADGGRLRSEDAPMASHGRTLETSASPERVWQLWSDVSTWPSWNPDVLSAAIDGPFVSGATGKMTTKAGGTHAITLRDVAPGRSFELETSPIP